jgi:hypothetical protein
MTSPTPPAQQYGYGYQPAGAFAGGGAAPPFIPGLAQLIEVDLVSGSVAKVMTVGEAEWFNKSRDSYLNETRFTENTDVQDLDRLLQLELLLYRWNQWSLAGVDYEGNLVDDRDLARKVKDQTDSINRLKEQMGLSQKSRASHAASVSERWDDLKRRAKEFGYHREEQMRSALVLMNELSAIVGAYDRSDEEERKKLGFETETDVLDWVRETMIPEFVQIDTYFRSSKQRMWNRS